MRRGQRTAAGLICSRVAPALGFESPARLMNSARLLARVRVVPAIGLALWGGAVVGLLDNLLGPKLMASGTRMHPLVMMLAVLGGISLFGPMGLLLGPIMVALLYALFDIYLGMTRQPERE